MTSLVGQRRLRIDSFHLFRAACTIKAGNYVSQKRWDYTLPTRTQWIEEETVNHETNFWKLNPHRGVCGRYTVLVLHKT
uniref:Uncharacterized protein n=1 Tax=Knipowitschia caucasica TaxID=637954 RepID=A0AAV2K488_KNICA